MVARGNPGPAGYGSVVWSSDHATVLAERKEAIGIATNNVAEYRGLIAGLEAAVDLRAEDVVVQMDWKLVVEQMSGRWKVKHAAMAELHQCVPRFGLELSTIAYRWIPREKNKHADRLANEAMDAAAGIEAAQPFRLPPRPEGGCRTAIRMDRKPRLANTIPVAAPWTDRVVEAAGAIRAGEIRNSLNWVAVRPTRPRAISRGAVASQRSSHRRCSELRTRRDVPPTHWVAISQSMTTSSKPTWRLGGSDFRRGGRARSGPAWRLAS